MGGANTFYAVKIPTSNPSPPPIELSVRNNAERTATRDAKEPAKSQTDAQVDYTVPVLQAETIPLTSVLTLIVRAAMRGLVAV